MKWLVLALTLLFAITPAAAWNKHGYGTPSAPTLPLIGNLVVRLSASDITGLSNGASVATWTAAVGGQVFTESSPHQPTYATNRLNSLPSVQFAGSADLCATTDPNSVLENVLASTGSPYSPVVPGQYTFMIVFRTLGNASNGTLFSAHNNNDTWQGNEFWMIADGTNLQQNSQLWQVPDSSQTSLTTEGVVSWPSGTYSAGNTGQLAQWYLNGGAVAGYAYSAPGDYGYAPCIGKDVTPSFPSYSKVEVFDILIWNTPLTSAQYKQAQHWVDAKYGQTDPWVGQSAFYVFYGDSIMNGNGTSDLIDTTPSYVAAVTDLGLKFGQYDSLGIGGIDTTALDSLASAGVPAFGSYPWIDNLPGYLGMKVKIAAFEWYNQHLGNNDPVPFDDAATFLVDRAKIANLEVAWGTSTSFASDPTTQRLLYDQHYDNNDTAPAIPGNVGIITFLSNSSFSYIPIHQDPEIGCNDNTTETACTALTGSSYQVYCNATGGSCNETPANWNDTIHLNGRGYGYLAADMVTGLNALP